MAGLVENACMGIALIVHGGAGSGRGEDPTRLEYLRLAAEEGYRILERGGSALDAVERAVIVMEDSGVFNAGLGSCLTFDGVVEMDAGIMDGATMSIGAVAAVKTVRNPVRLARKVMELTDHVLLAGEGAERLAEKLGLSIDEGRLVTPDKLRRLEEYKEKWRAGEEFRWLNRLRGVASYFGTVGAASIDRDGNVAAATSTGGYWLKLRGRIGDTPIPGAGFYADNSGGACSATGIGEVIIKSMLCYRAFELMRTGVSAMTAAKAAIEAVTSRLGEGTAGIITVDRRGGIGYAFNTQSMWIGYFTEGMDEASALALSRE